MDGRNSSTYKVDIAGSSNGRTSLFESGNFGSIPSPAAKVDKILFIS